MTTLNILLLAAGWSLAVLLPWIGLRVGSGLAGVLIISMLGSVVEAWRWQLVTLLVFGTAALVRLALAARRGGPATGRRSIAAIGLFSVAAALAAAPSVALPIYRLPTPSGPFHVGVRDMRIPSGRGPSILVRAWYPTDADAGRPFMRSAPESRLRARQFADRGLPGALYSYHEHIGANALWQAPLSRARNSYPAIVYNHGGEGDVAQSASLMEDLASHGYVVLSVGHPGQTLGILDERGQPVPAPVRSYQPVDRMKASGLARSRTAALAEILPYLRMATTESAMTRERVANTEKVLAVIFSGGGGEVLRRVDRREVASVGMSMGGAVAALTCEVDTRVAACVNLDGFQFGGLMGRSLRQPLLVAYTDHGYGLSDLFYRREDGSSDAPVDWFVIKGAQHGDLTDASFLTPFKVQLSDAAGDAELPFFGPIAPEKATKVQSDLIRFFLFSRAGFSAPQPPRALPRGVARYDPGRRFERDGATP
jgi:dienelactone hydrolase